MRGDPHVRFCERLGVRFPGATRLVMLFEEKTDGERVYEVLGKRLEKYGLILHETKTRYVDMRVDRKGGEHRFDFLGFTHVWGRSRKGNRVLKKTTAKDRHARAVSAVNEWCKKNRHLGVDAQAKHLGRVIRYQVTRIWRKWLSRRSSKGRVNWERMKEMLRRNPLPKARVMRSIYTT